MTGMLPVAVTKVQKSKKSNKFPLISHAHWFTKWTPVILKAGFHTTNVWYLIGHFIQPVHLYMYPTIYRLLFFNVRINSCPSIFNVQSVLNRPHTASDEWNSSTFQALSRIWNKNFSQCIQSLCFVFFNRYIYVSCQLSKTFQVNMCDYLNATPDYVENQAFFKFLKFQDKPCSLFLISTWYGGIHRNQWTSGWYYYLSDCFLFIQDLLKAKVGEEKGQQKLLFSTDRLKLYHTW